MNSDHVKEGLFKKIAPAQIREGDYDEIVNCRDLFKKFPRFDRLFKLYEISCNPCSTLSDLRLEILSLANEGQFTGSPAQKGDNLSRAEKLLTLLDFRFVKIEKNKRLGIVGVKFCVICA